MKDADINRSPQNLKSPQLIHPQLWRANSLHRAARPTVPTGYAALNRLLPGQGWPLGSVTELLCKQPGSTELALLAPALATLAPELPIMLLNPPLQPFFQCFWNLGLGRHRWFWLRAHTITEALWAAEQLLKSNVCGALVCWAATLPANTVAVRRLQLAAQSSSTLFFLARPASAMHLPTSATLRVLATPCHQGIDLQVLKRSGPPVHEKLTLVLHPQPEISSLVEHHGIVDQPLSARNSGHPEPSGNIERSGTDHARLHA